VYQTAKLLADQGEQLTDDERSSVEEKLAALSTTLEGDDIEAIADATDTLMTASQEFGQRLYEAAQAEAASAGASAGASDGSGSDEDVVDAEIVNES